MKGSVSEESESLLQKSSKEFNQSWAFAGLFWFCWLSVLDIIWASVLVSAISGLSYYALGCLT